VKKQVLCNGGCSASPTASPGYFVKFEIYSIILINTSYRGVSMKIDTSALANTGYMNILFNDACLFTKYEIFLLKEDSIGFYVGDWDENFMPEENVMLSIKINDNIYILEGIITKIDKRRLLVEMSIKYSEIREEKRQSKRHIVSLEALLIKSDDSTKPAKIENISRNGALINLDEDFDIGNNISLRIMNNQNIPFSLEAKIMKKHTTKAVPVYGIRFILINKDLKKEYSKFFNDIVKSLDA
jgi:hypothetical protein